MSILSFFIGMLVGALGAAGALLLFIGNNANYRREMPNIPRSYE